MAQQWWWIRGNSLDRADGHVAIVVQGYGRDNENKSAVLHEDDVLPFIVAESNSCGNEKQWSPRARFWNPTRISPLMSLAECWSSLTVHHVTNFKVAINENAATETLISHCYLSSVADFTRDQVPRNRAPRSNRDALLRRKRGRSGRVRSVVEVPAFGCQCGWRRQGRRSNLAPDAFTRHGQGRE